MWSSYRLVAMLMRPILDRPKSVSLMWPREVMSRLWTRPGHPGWRGAGGGPEPCMVAKTEAPTGRIALVLF